MSDNIQRPMKSGAVTKWSEGAVNAIVKLDIEENIGLTSTISLEAVKELGLKAGEKATAIIKATSVMIMEA